MNKLRESLSGDELRFSPIHDNDHAGYIWIVAIMALIYSLAATITRIFIKISMFGTDDYLLVASMVFHIAQSIAIFAGLGQGLGKFNSITTTEQWASAGKAYYAADIFFFLALCLSKCSVLGLILRVVEDKTSTMRRLCIGTIGLNLVWGLLSVLLATISCPADTILGDSWATCPAQEARWYTTAIIDIATELTICVFPIALVWSIHMSVSLKIQVAAAFVFRLPLIPLAVVRVHLLGATAASAEPLFTATDVVSLNQVILCWSILSANIPNLKQFLKSFFTGLGYPLTIDEATSAGRYGTSRRGSYALRSVRRTGGRSGNASATTTRVAAVGGKEDGDEEPHAELGGVALRSASQEHKAGVLLHHKDGNAAHGSIRNTSDNDGHSRTGSQEMIIRREFEW